MLTSVPEEGFMEELADSSSWYRLFRAWLETFHLPDFAESLIYHATICISALLIAVFFYFITRASLALIAKRFRVVRSNVFMQALFTNHVFNILSYYLPFLFLKYIVRVLLPSFPPIVSDLYASCNALFFAYLLSACLNAYTDIYQAKEQNKSRPIKAIVQFLQVFIYSFAAVVCVSIFSDIPLKSLLSGLGAASAILILLFKDTITGLVAGIQLSVNKMVRVGDWISMDKYGINGEVLEINITSVKIRNFDKTYATIPAYNLISSDSVKNWQGMLEFGGRRIARPVYIDMHSVQFCTSEMLDRYMKFKNIAQHIQDTQFRINDNSNVKMDLDYSLSAYGTQQTNLGIFRAYLTSYLNTKSGLFKENIMVRQLEPTANGIPLQIYCFTNTTVWAEYEKIQSDIFDHILAVLPFFDLKVFQIPNGHDFVELAKALSSNSD